MRASVRLALLLVLAGALPAHAEAPLRCPQQKGSADGDVFAEVKRDFQPGKAPPIFLALGKERHPALQKLLAAGANPNVCHAGLSPMMLAGAGDDQVAAGMLLDAGALPDRPRDSRGATVLHTVIGLGKLAMAALLLDRGADPRLVDDHGNTMLHNLALQPAPVAGAQRILQATLAERLLARQVPLDAQSSRGSTALILSIAAGNEYLTAWLLERGANPKLANQRGEDALAYARRLGRAPLVALLERHSASTPRAKHD